jgi:O-antigen ligase
MSLAVALAAGGLAAMLQLAGGLKSAPALDLIPFDLTLAALLGLLPCLALLAATRRWHLDTALALPIAAAALLILWLVIAGAWSASRTVAAAKLPEVVLAGPAMLAAGLIAGADPAARRALAGTSLLIGLVLAAVIGWSVAHGAGGGWLGAAASGPERAGVHHQLAGLALAIAAGLAAVRATAARGWLAALGWTGLVALLGVAALLPGGRTALVALGLGVALAPMLGLWRAGRGRAAAGWALGCGVAAVLFALSLALNPADAERLRTIERLTGDSAGLEARLGLWAAALDWAGRTAPFGLGTGGFTIAAGHGERRGLYPHNHALEALAEGGLPGLILWLGAFGGAVPVALRALRQADMAPRRVAEVAAMVLPVALTVMVSTDLGNRMAWFALGLALSLGVTATARSGRRATRHV